MYYIAKTVLKWGDIEFWDSSPAFLFRQFDLFIEHNKSNVKHNKIKNNNNTTTVRKKFKVINNKEGD